MSNCESESSRVFICGTVHNCENLLEAAFNDIKKIAERFADFHIIIAFYESTDNTLLVLNQYKRDFRDKMDILVNTFSLQNPCVVSPEILPIPTLSLPLCPLYGLH